MAKPIAIIAPIVAKRTMNREGERASAGTSNEDERGDKCENKMRPPVPATS